VHQVQWWDPTPVIDHDLTCPAYSPTPVRAFPPTLGSDLTGDWKNDLVARQAGTGTLWLYPGTGRSPAAIGPRSVLGTGWSGFTMIETPGDLDGNGVADLLARTTAGQLWLYPRTGSGFGPRVGLGTGWQAYSMLTGPGDLSGDGRPDLLGVDSSGRLWLWPGTGTGGFGTRRLIGSSGWNSMNLLVGAGDWNRDGIPDLLARSAGTGTLYLYPRTATGWGSRVTIGTGWNAMRIAGTGDMDGDALPDLVAVQAGTGRLWLYPRSETGWRPRVGIGTGWNVMNLLT
jgi:hypothetical protein